MAIKTSSDSEMIWFIKSWPRVTKTTSEKVQAGTMRTIYVINPKVTWGSMKKEKQKKSDLASKQGQKGQTNKVMELVESNKQKDKWKES